MTPCLKPYSTMKDSGVEWLGEVPEHWEVRRLGDSITDCINGSWGHDPNEVDDLPCVRVADFDRSSLRVRKPIPTIRAIPPNERRRRMLQPGDLLLEKSGGGEQQPVGVVILFDHDTLAVCSNFVARMPVREGFDSHFLTFLHSALYSIRLNTRSIKQTTGIQNLDSAAYLSESVGFPPLSEQSAIVRYLDYVERRGRRFVGAKEKLIGLLEKQKQVIIHRAVTRGLDPDVPLKPSGIAWLGEVPEHWEIRRLKTCVANITEQTKILKSDERYIALEHVESWTGKILEPASEQSFDSQVKRFQSGDVLLGKLRPYLAKVTRPKHKGVCVSEFLVLRPRLKKLSSPYLEQSIRSKSIIEAINASTFGAKMPRADWQFIGSMEYAIPPLPEQTAIVEYLDKATANIDAAIARTHREIELLNEYRTRLIADVVTGKLDVREAAAGLPDEPDETELPDDDAPLNSGEKPAKETKH